MKRNLNIFRTLLCVSEIFRAFQCEIEYEYIMAISANFFDIRAEIHAYIFNSHSCHLCKKFYLPILEAQLSSSIVFFF